MPTEKFCDVVGVNWKNHLSFVGVQIVILTSSTINVSGWGDLSWFETFLLKRVNAYFLFVHWIVSMITTANNIRKQTGGRQVMTFAEGDTQNGLHHRTTQGHQDSNHEGRR